MCENPSVAERWNADRFADVILPDGETREVRVAKDTSSSARDAAAETPTRGFPRYRARRRGAARRVASSASRRRGPGIRRAVTSASIRACRQALRAGLLHLEGVGGCARGRAESRGRSRRAGRRLALLQPLGSDARAPRHGEGAGRLSRARRSQGGVGRRLSSHAARQTGGAPANGLNASIDEDL